MKKETVLEVIDSYIEDTIKQVKDEVRENCKKEFSIDTYNDFVRLESILPFCSAIMELTPNGIKKYLLHRGVLKLVNDSYIAVENNPNCKVIEGKIYILKSIVKSIINTNLMIELEYKDILDERTEDIKKRKKEIGKACYQMSTSKAQNESEHLKRVQKLLEENIDMF